MYSDLVRQWKKEVLTMAEYIEREAFIKRLENEADKSSDIINLLILNGIANIVRDENIAPTADVVEVVHGEWLDNGDRDNNGVPKPFAISCSALSALLFHIATAVSLTIYFFDNLPQQDVFLHLGV